MMWTKYGQENMANMKIHGKFGVGFKRWKSAEKGTDCLIFYPCDARHKIKSVTPYNDVAKTRKGYSQEGFSGNHILHRTISGLRPNIPLDGIFMTGEKKLIPMVYVHGGMMCAAEHCGAAMQLASMGYLVISADMPDGSCAWTTDKNGDDIWPGMPELKNIKAKEDYQLEQAKRQ